MTNSNTPPKITDATVKISWSPDGTTTTGAYFGYTTVATVQYRFAQYSTQVNQLIATPPAIHPIGEEITWAAIDLQLLLNHLYVMPYTGTDATILGMLSDMNAKLATARLIDRMYQSNEPNLSQVAALLRTEVGGIIDDLKTGLIIWYAPYGDATPQSRAPVYDTSLGATIWPNDGAAQDDATNAPWFTMGRTSYRRGSTM